MKLLFIPGSGSGEKAWAYQTEYFTGSEAVALPGRYEGSPCSSVDGYVEWLRAYIKQQRYEDVVLVGHSLGGAIAQLYGLKYADEAKALVLIGTGARLRVLPAFLKALEGLVSDGVAWREYLEGSYSLVAPEVRRAVIEEMMLIGPAVMLSDLLCCDKFDIMDRVHSIKLPALIIGGSEDEMTPVKYARYMADRIAGATQVIIEGATHMVFMEKPGEVNQAIQEFLTRLD